MPQSLTWHLINLAPRPLKEATTHPFLAAAAHATLPLPHLQAWLAQDRLYQISYVPFIGSTLARLPIPAAADREHSLHWRAVSLLVDCLTNIRDEMRLFEQTAAAEGWLAAICDVAPSVQTRAYQDLFAGATAQGRPALVALVVLWATEFCYLTAWRWARGQMREGLREEEMDVMQRTFIPVWSSEEFEGFVERIRGVVDDFGEVAGDGDPGSWEWKECEVAWRQVLWAEREFWPDVEK